MNNFFENLFSRRKLRLEGKEKDYYEYEIPENVRWQIIHIIFENIDAVEEDEFEQKFAKELGLPTISNEISTKNKIQSFILKESTENIISLIEFLLQLKMYFYKKADLSRNKLRAELEKIFHEINRAFKINNIGYEIVPIFLKEDLPFIIVPIYSKYLHIETIKRPINLMHNSDFKGALNEFETALDNFKDNNYSGAITEANKSFEGTMKSIMDKRNIVYDENDTAKLLFDKLSKSNFIEPRLKDCFDRLINILESGLPTIRNQPGAAHTQGLDVKKIEKSYAEFSLNLAGSYIVFLINRYEESK